MTEEYVDRNKSNVRYTIAKIIEEMFYKRGFDITIGVKDVRVTKRGMLKIFNMDIYLDDRHYHYPLVKDHLYYLYDYFKSIETLFTNVMHDKVFNKVKKQAVKLGKLKRMSY